MTPRVTNRASAAVLRQSMAALVQLAARAPSPANSQPWRFRERHGGLELLLDRTRLVDLGSAADAVEAAERQGRLACGASLLNLRLAIGHLGYQPLVALLPLPQQDPDLLARVELGPSCPPADDDQRLYAGIVYRHTQRDAFDPESIPTDLLAVLVDQAAVEAATLFLADPARQAALDHITAAVEARGTDLIGQAGLRSSWLRGPAASGIATAVLTTPGDDPHDHLVAGQALERVLLTAAPHWVFARLATRPLEDARTRASIQDAIRAGVPQMLLQLGRSHIAPTTPRRSLAQILQPPQRAAPPPV
jgi:hypothetical protein